MWPLLSSVWATPLELERNKSESPEVCCCGWMVCMLWDMTDDFDPPSATSGISRELVTGGIRGAEEEEMEEVGAGP